MRRLILIPARGGSKGVPGKNIKLLGGRPLIYYTLDAAMGIDGAVVCVSTDSEEIKAVVEEYGIEVPFLRPPELASDTSGMDEVIKHAISYYEERDQHFDQIVLLQPTSPFRTADHVGEALALYSDDVDMIVSVKETDSNPYYVLFEENVEGCLEKSKQGDFVRRQDCPIVYELNGAIYVINASSFKKQGLIGLAKKKKQVMSAEASLDIDSSLDWLIAESLLQMMCPTQRL